MGRMQTGLRALQRREAIEASHAAATLIGGSQAASGSH